ncbi:MAG: hypothetical protein Q8M31_17375 [Beijerinckiaceae bacterium]|nr:hypothetical protein [Beijerinckiaceae bacterium]
MVSTSSRVSSQTATKVNRQIRQNAITRIAYFINHPEDVHRRLHELDQEWDVERVIEANASTLAFTGIVLGITVDRRWLALPFVVTAFLFQHAVQGWCPPVPVLRRLGFRTADEINQERYALKAIQGDFERIPKATEGKLTPVLKAVDLI